MKNLLIAAWWKCLNTTTNQPAWLNSTLKEMNNPTTKTPIFIKYFIAKIP